jgi:hypothetical protein
METHRKLSTVLTKDVVATGNVSVFNPYTVLFFLTNYLFLTK